MNQGDYVSYLAQCPDPECFVSFISGSNLNKANSSPKLDAFYSPSFR